jgi:hypothetical protein
VVLCAPEFFQLCTSNGLKDKENKHKTVGFSMTRYNRFDTSKINHFGNIKFVSFVGGPNSGKSSLLTGLKHAAVYIAGMAFVDMSAVIEWHRDPKKESPYKGKFDALKAGMKVSDLVSDDDLIMDALLYYLSIEQQTCVDQRIRTVIASGVPRNRAQMMKAERLFPGMRQFTIDSTQDQANTNRLIRLSDGPSRADDKYDDFVDRWTTYERLTLPPAVEFASRNPDRSVRVKISLDPSKKALAAIRLMELTEAERASMVKQVLNPAYDAYKHFKKLTEKKAPGAGIPLELQTPHVSVSPARVDHYALTRQNA